MRSTLKEYLKDREGFQSPIISGDGSLLKEMLNGAISGVASRNTLDPQRAMQGRLMRVHHMDDEHEEEAEGTASNIEQSRAIFNSMARNPGVDRMQIIDAMMKYAGVTQSTAVSYYQRLAKEAGMTNQGGEGEDSTPMVASNSMAPNTRPTMGNGQDPKQPTMNMNGDNQMGNSPEDPTPPQEIEHTFPDNPNKQGIIRHVDRAHLVFKRQSPEGTFEELWIYNIDTDMKDELSIRRKILAGTDIPAQKTTSPDGSQSYTLATMGNGQILHITGLPQ